MIQVANGTPFSQVEEATFFPFDNFSIPLKNGLQLSLVSGKKYPANPVVRMGAHGTPDSKSVSYYGTVIYIDGEYRMWYQGTDTPDAGWPGWGPGRVCYAVSKDGIHWEKPKLGLVEYDGNTENNLVDLNASLIRAAVVLYEPEDPDPTRRFKIAYESDETENRISVAYSPDGLRWKQSPNNPVGPELEMGGLIKFNGCYYLNGQLNLGSFASQDLWARRMYTFMSYDFEHWSESSVLSFKRDNHSFSPHLGIHQGEQVHMGAALWDRGNVVLGFYGQWHGPDNDDRRFVNMDLGLIVSNDALHFHEPIADFKMIRSNEEPDGAYPCLVQGQGFENIEDQTLVWYGAWKDGEVRVATWPRDRLGYYSVSGEVVNPYFVTGSFKRETNPHFITCPLCVNSFGYRIFINADGLSTHSYLKIEICDQQFRGLPGYSGGECIPITESGLRQPVVWRNEKTLAKFDQPIRIRVNYEGIRSEDAHVYAVYVSKRERLNNERS